MEIFYCGGPVGVSGGVGEPSNLPTGVSHGSFTKVHWLYWLQISSLCRNLRAWLEMPWMPCNLRRCSTVVTVTMPVEIFQVGVEDVYIYIHTYLYNIYIYCKCITLVGGIVIRHYHYLLTNCNLFLGESEWLTRDSPNKRNIDLHLLSILNVKPINTLYTLYITIYTT